jgi:probable rRNA maturation factor
MSSCSASSKPMRNMKVHVEIQFATDEECALSSGDIVSWIQRSLELANVTVNREGKSEVSVRVVGAEEMQALNNEFRDKDWPTNILSFPAGAIQGLPADSDMPLGDLVICASVVNEEAGQQGKSKHDHWGHIIVHGSLHLLGFDHSQDEEAAVMEGLEIEILSAYGITNPYVDSVRESPV